MFMFWLFSASNLVSDSSSSEEEDDNNLIGKSLYHLIHPCDAEKIKTCHKQRKFILHFGLWSYTDWKFLD